MTTRTIRDLPLYEWSGNYNIMADTIQGCTVGSKTWWHEKRHQWQYHTFEKPMRGYQVISGIAQFAAPLALIAGDIQLLMYSAAAMLPIGIILLAAEIDAEIYSWKKYFADVEIPQGAGNGTDDNNFSHSSVNKAANSGAKPQSDGGENTT